MDQRKEPASIANSSVTMMREGRSSRPGRRVLPQTLATFIASWQLSLDAAARWSRTVRSYTDSPRP